MNTNLLILGIILGALQLVIPRTLFFIPLIAATFLAPKYPFILELNCQRLVILMGLVRLIITRKPHIEIVRVDKAVIAASACIIASSFFHQPDANTSSPLLFRIRFVFDIISVYLFSRLALTTFDDFVALCRSFAFVTPLLAIPMMAERISGQNLFSIVGARLETSLVRDGRIRACGPFGTPILAGTAGALTLPFILFYYYRSRILAAIGLVAALAIVFASSSSGPVGTSVFALGGLMLWRFRTHWRTGLYLLVGSFFFLLIAMERPPWYVLSMIDIVGGSTGWHRAKLIDAAVNDLSAWILWGTDYTRDWMPYGLPTVPNHVDLTNYYIHIGVIAGLPAALLILCAFVGTFCSSIKYALLEGDKWLAKSHWHIAACIASITITGFTISFYDQGYIFPYITIAAYACLRRQSEALYYNQRFSDYNDAQPALLNEQQRADLGNADTNRG